MNKNLNIKGENIIMDTETRLAYLKEACENIWRAMRSLERINENDELTAPEEAVYGKLTTAESRLLTIGFQLSGTRAK